MAHPKTLGLTGEAIAHNKTIISRRGQHETGYNAQTDNAARLKNIQNMMIMPLTVPSSHGDVDVVGVLHLLNFDGDIAKCETVCFVDMQSRRQNSMRLSTSWPAALTT